MKKIKVLKTSLILALVTSVVCSFLTWQTSTVKAIESVAQMFVNASQMTITQSAEAPDTFLDYKGNTIARDFDLGMKGVLLSSTSVDSSVQLAPSFSGPFSMTFRAYSDVSFGSDNPNEFNVYSYVMTEYADLREISFIFEDKNGKSFTVAIAAGEKYNVITPAARVIVGNTAFGYHYLNDATVPNNTQAQNAGGYFTRIGGTTFCNVGRTGGAQTSAKSHPLTFGFDPDTMEVYVIHYGTWAEKVEYRLVADLDNEVMGLGKLTSFEDYKVTVKFTDISAGKDANVLVYDVNGQSLDGTKFTDNAGPTTSVKKEYNAVQGKKYYLPTPTAFDLLEGKLAYNGSVSVNGGTVPVYTAEGGATTTWSKGCYFIPNDVGDYTVTYLAKDGKGNEGVEKSITVTALASIPEYSFEVQEGTYVGIENGEPLGAGTSFALYPVKVSSSLFTSGKLLAQATLLKDGAVYQGIQNKLIEKTEEVVLEAGEYTLLYNISGYPDTIKKEYNITVSSELPVFTFGSAFEALLETGKETTLPRVTATLNGKKTLASVTLYAPDGSLVPVSNNKAMIEQIGLYKAIYTANINGAMYTHSAYFNAAYSTNDSLIGNNDTVVVERGTSGDLYANEMEGIKVTYYETDRFATYSKTIDLSKLDPNEAFIKVMVLPKTRGILDFWQYTIRLTDVNDAKNYVDIVVFKGSWGNEYSYLKAGANGQKPGGWEMGKFLTSYNAGTPILYSFTAESASGAEQLSLYYNYEDHSVSVANIKRPGYPQGNEIADLDGADCFGENIFKGFSTGEVYLSISVQDMQSDQATLLVTEINGISLSQQWINDTTKPVIGVDMLGYSEDSAPLGLVGVEYPVFPANAFDSADGHTAMSVEVYKNYQTGAQQKLSVENGKFLPETTGEYSIVYSSADKSGNKASKVIKITVVDTLEDFSYSFNKPLKLEYKLGEYFAISAGKASGGSGNAQATVSVIAPNGEVIEEPNGALIDQEGTYVVRINFEDFIGRKQVISYTATSTISPSPIIYEASLPTAFINGNTYILPDFYAVDYSTGTLQEPTKSIKVVYNGVETVIGEDRKFTPHVENHQDTVKIIYAAENENGMVSYYEYLAKVLIVSNASGLDMSAYFALDNMTAGEKTASYVEFLTSTEGAGLTFVNPLIASGLSLEVYVPKAKNKFSSLTITLTDALDSTIATSFTIYKHINNANYSYLEHNGEKVNIAGNFFDLTSYGLSVSYNNTSRYLFDRNANKNLLVLSTNLNGEEFNGFPSGKVYMSMKINGVEGESSLQIRLIGNQNFSNLTTDRVLPQIQLSSFITRTMEIGEQLKVPAAIAADVLSKDVTLKVTIKKGSKVLYTGSIDEDFYYTPEQYGSYRIEYSATAGNRTSTSAYFVEVKDRENPTLTLSGAVPTTGNIGKVITLPTAMVADNHSQNLRVWIYITEPTGRMITLEEGATTFVPQMSGRYRVTYYVHDDYANYVYEKFIITVQ